MSVRRLAVGLTMLVVYSVPAQDSPATQRPDLTGAIVGTGRKPIVGATVAIYTAGPRTGTNAYCPSCYPDCAKTATTDPDGKFTIRSLDPNLIFRVLVVAEGFTPEFIDRVDPTKKAIEASLKPTDPTRLKPGQVLRGRVLDPEGKPVFGASVSSFGMRSSANLGTYGRLPGIDPLAVTNAKGEFTLTADKPGVELVVRVEARGYLRFTSPFLNVGDETHELKVKYGAAVRGRVIKDGKPLPDVEVGIVQVNRNATEFLGHQTIATGSDGKFVLQNIGPNEDHYLFGIMNSLKGFGTIPIQKVSVGADATDTNAGDLVVKPGFVLAGRVILADGKAIPAGTRSILSRDLAWDSQIVELGRNGEFSFEGLPAEKYSFHAAVKGYHPSRRNASFDIYNMASLVGQVVGDEVALRVLMEPGPFEVYDHSKPMTRAEFDAFRRILESPLRGIPKVD
jgi:hypothetical protein